MYQKFIWTTLNSTYSWYKGLVICDEQSCTSFNQQTIQAGTWLAYAAKELVANGPQYPPPYMLDHWTVSDLYEESGASVGGATGPGGGMNLFCRGTTTYANSWDIGKPPINAYNLLKRLGSMEDSSSGGVAANGDGVNLIATSDSSNNSIQVLVYSFFKSHVDGHLDHRQYYAYNQQYSLGARTGARGAIPVRCHAQQYDLCMDASR